MILDAIFALLLTPLTWMMGLLPTFTPPASFTDTGGGVGLVATATSIGQGLGQLDSWVPTSLLAACVAIIVTALAAGVVVRGVVFVYEHIPGKSA